MSYENQKWPFADLYSRQSNVPPVHTTVSRAEDVAYATRGLVKPPRVAALTHRVTARDTMRPRGQRTMRLKPPVSGYVKGRKALRAARKRLEELLGQPIFGEPAPVLPRIERQTWDDSYVAERSVGYKAPANEVPNQPVPPIWSPEYEAWAAENRAMVQMADKERQADCPCMCHEGGPATEHELQQRCPCKGPSFRDRVASLHEAERQAHRLRMAIRQPVLDDDLPPSQKPFVHETDHLALNPDMAIDENRHYRVEGPNHGLVCGVCLTPWPLNAEHRYPTSSEMEARRGEKVTPKRVTGR